MMGGDGARGNPARANENHSRPAFHTFICTIY